VKEISRGVAPATIFPAPRLDFRAPGRYSILMTTTQNAADLPGTTVHVLRNTRYEGAFTITEIVGTEGEWVSFKAGKVQYAARLIDFFATEAEAKAEAKARRAPRTARQPQPLYGDYAQFAALQGIATDGTGRRVRR
jgi:hypothetical protein